jgi:hypothetical protein
VERVDAAEEPKRPRIFSIPPPPVASFDKKGEVAPQAETDEPDDDDELIERLLQEDESIGDDGSTYKRRNED